MEKAFKIFVGFCLVVILLHFLCSFSYYDKKNSDVSNIRLCEYKLNGHYYVVATKVSYDGGIGIIHSPNCKCGRN